MQETSVKNAPERSHMQLSFTLGVYLILRTKLFNTYSKKNWKMNFTNR